MGAALSRGSKFPVVVHLTRRGVAVRYLITQARLDFTDEEGRNLNYAFKVEGVTPPIRMSATDDTHTLTFSVRVLDSFPAGSFGMVLTVTPHIEFEQDNAPPQRTAKVAPQAAASAVLKLTVIDKGTGGVLRMVSMERTPRGATAGEDFRVVSMARTPGGSEQLPVGARFTITCTLKNTTGRVLTTTGITVAIQFRQFPGDRTPPTTGLLGQYFQFLNEGADSLSDLSNDPGDTDTMTVEFQFRIQDNFPAAYYGYPIVFTPTVKYRLQAEEPPHDLEGEELTATLDGNVASNQDVVFSVRGPADVTVTGITRNPSGATLFRGETCVITATMSNEAQEGGNADAAVKALTMTVAEVTSLADITDRFDISNPSAFTFPGGQTGREVEYEVRVDPSFPDFKLSGMAGETTVFFRPAVEFQRNEQPPTITASVDDDVYSQATLKVAARGPVPGSGVLGVQLYRDRPGTTEFNRNTKLTWYLELRNGDGTSHTIEDGNVGFSVETVDTDEDVGDFFEKSGVVATRTIAASGGVLMLAFEVEILDTFPDELLDRDLRLIPSVGYEGGGTVAMVTQVSTNTGVTFRVGTDD